MRQMMGGKKNIALVAKLLADGIPHEQLLFEPGRHLGQKRQVAVGRRRQVGHQQPFKLDERLVVKGDIVHLVYSNASFPKTILHRMPGETGIVFLA